jgi:hypothetical protein
VRAVRREAYCLRTVMIDGQESSGGEPPRRSEGDLLSERRARRVAESGEAALMRRAEAAEATVHTLERHVASLQQRLREAEDEHRVMAERIEAEKALASEREGELRRISQREYAEQQLRVEAEERLGGLGRESSAELERLSARMTASAHEVRVLSEQIESMQRQLSEAEQAAAAQNAALRRSEAELRTRIGELEGRSAELARGLDIERSARERSERLLDGMRDGYRQLAALLLELKALIPRLLPALAPAERQVAAPPVTQPPPAAQQPPPVAQPGVTHPPAVAPQAQGESLLRGAPVSERRSTPAPAQAPAVEMADALAAAVERLRTRAQALTPAGEQFVPKRELPASHKHSMSLVRRLRIRRKQRRGR